VGCYVWYSEEGPGRAAAPPSPLLVVLPNVTVHEVYQLHIIRILYTSVYARTYVFCRFVPFGDCVLMFSFIMLVMSPSPYGRGSKSFAFVRPSVAYIVINSRIGV